MRLIMVRYDKTVWNAERRLQGHTDAPLSPRHQADAAGGEFLRWRPDPKPRTCLGHGQFITVALNSIIVAWVLFFVIRAMNRLKRQEDAKTDVPQAPEIPADVKLLAEIRDLLATGQAAGGAGIKPE